MAKSRIKKYVMTDIIGKSQWETIICPTVVFHGEDCGGANFSFRWSYMNEPFQMIKEPHEHDFDQMIGFLGGNPQNIADFRAEVEFFLDGEKLIIKQPTFIRIPKGMPHGPLTFKKIDLPIMFFDLPLSPGYTRVGHPEIARVPGPNQ